MVKRQSTELTDKQRLILAYLREYIGERRFPPSVREIMRGCDISSTSVVFYNLRILEEFGYLVVRRGAARSIKLLERDGGAGVEVPLRGDLAVGEPMGAGAPATFEAPRSLVDGRLGVFGLRARGGGFAEALVADGDTVLFESTVSVEDGDMVAACITSREEAALRRYYRDGDEVRLQAESGGADAIRVEASDMEVWGRMVGMIRTSAAI